MEYIFKDNYAIGITSNGIKFLFDIEDYPIIEPHSWCESSGYIHRNKRGVDVKLHRLVTNCPNNMVVDHINHDTLDNRKANLRICTPSENARNKIYMSNNTSGKLGVYWKSNRQKWVAQIKINGVVKHLGIFEDYNEAVDCRKKAERIYFGEYSATM